MARPMSRRRRRSTSMVIPGRQHATLKADAQPRMSRVTTLACRRDCLAGSVGGRAPCVPSALLALGSGEHAGARASLGAPVDRRRRSPSTAVGPALAGADRAARRRSPLPDVDVAPRARPWDAPEGDRDNLAALTTAPSDSDGRRRPAPAPDQGENGGHPPDHAYRRDKFDAYDRVSPTVPRRRSRRAREPRAVRPRRRRSGASPWSGIGDAVRTRGAAPGAVARASATSTSAIAGPSGGGPAEAAAEAPAASEPPPPVPSAELAALAVPARAQSVRSTPSRARAASTPSARARPPTTTRCARPRTSSTPG